MYSNSASFIGGGNSNRGPPYGQSPFQNSQQQQPQQPPQNGFIPQPTGFAGNPLPVQYTGYPVQQPAPFQSQLQQPQATGYPPASQGQMLQSPPLPQQPTRTGIPPAKTGQTSAQIAQSFAGTASQQESKASSQSNSAKIPKIRLSFLTAEDQAKFEQLFKSAVEGGQALSGDKVRDLLLRSKLPGNDLAQIWVLADTTKSGQLLFPEFALAMYLCNLRLVGKALPQALPETISNEVSSMVDIISFGVPDDHPPQPARSNAPNFNAPQRATEAQSIQQPQPQASNSQLLAQLTSQPTGFAAQYIPPQATGYLPQQLSAQLQPRGFSPQQTGFQQNPQSAGYSGVRPPMPPMPTGFNTSSYSVGVSGPVPPLNAQPTGRPGQWGLVNTPASGLPNIEALQQRMMPQPGREGGFTTTGLSGTAKVPWAVTKDEKRIYDQLFKAWDGLNKGFVGGDVAIEVMGQSGLDKADLEKIWTLSDPTNKGKLDMDEFAVAMHLIYRKLNGYPVPNRLPPELVPPSTRNFADSIGTVKSLLSQDAESRKNTGGFSQPQSYLKTHSFRAGASATASARKDATVYRNNDDDVGYKSSARRRLGVDGRSPSPAQSASPPSEASTDGLNLDQLRKRVKEKQVLLDAMDFKHEDEADEDEALDRKDRREAEDLYRRIRKIQEDIDSHPGASLRNVDSSAERRSLKRELQTLTDRLPEIASNVRLTERGISEAKLELFRLKDAQEHPTGAAAIVGTGPGGVVTESDRLKARAKAMMQQRSAALTGKASPGNTDDLSAASKRLEAENQRIRAEKENNERMIKDVEDGVRAFSKSLEDNLKDGAQNSSSEHEKRRWEDGLGVEDEVKDFIFELQRSSRSSRIRKDGTSRGRSINTSDHSDLRNDDRDDTPTRRDATPAQADPKSTTAATGGSSYSSYKTAEERAAFIKQQAEQRMAERLAALGLKPPTKPGETAQQKQARESREREDRRRQAEADDAKRDQERQQRLADENPSPPSMNNKTSGKKPLPPPPRKSRGESIDQPGRNQPSTVSEVSRERRVAESKDIETQRHAQEIVAQDLQGETDKQERELAAEQEAAQARLKALEDQVKAGQVKKQEAKRRKQAVDKETRERETRLALQRTELEAAKERERQLRLKLENIEDQDLSDDEDPIEVEKTPTSSQILSRGPEVAAVGSRDAGSAPDGIEARTSSSVTSPGLGQSPGPSHGGETKNPFFKKLSQSSESGAAAAASSSLASSSVASPATKPQSFNPFHRMAQEERALNSTITSPMTPTGTRPSRVRPEEDEWSVVDSSTGDSSDDEDDKPTGGSAKQLASILFGTMGPPRPMSAMDEKKSSSTPKQDRALSPVMSEAPTFLHAPGAPPPPPPPMPESFNHDVLVTPPNMPGSFDSAPYAPPPPPPPMPGAFGGAPNAPPPPPPPFPSASGPSNGKPVVVGALLGEIVKGKGLRKVETKDRSTASVAGRVLN